MAVPRTPRGRARAVVERLRELYPGSAKQLCALQHHNAYELLVATILSAQCTDARVNLVTPEVFKRYPEPEDLAGADPAELEELIKSTGFFRAKTKNLIGMARAVTDRYGGEVPSNLDELVQLPGVGRKTANVVLSVAYGEPGLPVDTHVARLSNRLGLSTSSDPVRIESDLCALIARSEWGALSIRLILHGRNVCLARAPRCERCVLSDFCPSSAVPVVTRRRPRAKVASAGA